MAVFHFVLILLISFTTANKEAFKNVEKPEQLILSVETIDTYHQFTSSAPDVGIIICNAPNSICQYSIPQWTRLLRQYESENKLGQISLGVIDLLEEDNDYALLKGIPSAQDGLMVWYQDGQLLTKLLTSPGYTDSFMYTWMESNQARELDTLGNMEVFQHVQKSCANATAAVVLLTPRENTNIEKKLLSVSRHIFGSLIFFAVRDEALISQLFGELTEPKIVIYRCEKDGVQVIDIESDTKDTEESLSIKIYSKGLPNFGLIDKAFVERGKVLYNMTVLIGIEENEKDYYEKWSTPIQNAQIAWDTIDNLKDKFVQFGATGRVWPTALFLHGDAFPIMYDEALPFNVNSLQTFINQVHEGTHPIFKRSAPIPTYVEGEIRSIVRDNFENEVLDSPVPGLCLFTVASQAGSAYIGHAHDLLQRLITYLDYYNIEISIVTYDVKYNYPPEEFTAAPQFILYRERTPHSYDGKQTLKAMSKWLNSFFPVHDEL